MNTTTSPAIEAVELPPLPKPYWYAHRADDSADSWPDMFTASQMREYAKSYGSALLAAKQEEVDRMRADLFPLQEFMDSIFGEFPDHGDIDGFDLQDIAEACGLLKKETTVTPCGEHCGCAENGIADGTETQCYRVQPVMRRARIAVAKARAALSPIQGA